MKTSSKEQAKEKKRKQLALQRKYGIRITTARKGREAFAAKDYLRATNLYQDYLSTLAELKELEDIYKLSAEHFDEKTELTEMLLISHIYWDLARINEMTPKLQSAFQLSLNQFIAFTINQPYQVLNAEMLRRYIKKNKGRTPRAEQLNAAYNQIFVQSAKCYIATLCFGENHRTTQSLRLLKHYLLQSRVGFKFVEVYYRLSSPLVHFLENKKSLTKIVKITTSPLLSFIAFLVNKNEDRL